jgi:hypothetical protein
MNARLAATLTLLSVVFVVSGASAEKSVDDGYRKNVSSLLEVMGANRIGEQIAYAIAQETFQRLAASGATITEPIQQLVIDEALEEFGTAFSNDEYLMDLYTPLFFEHFSREELQEVLNFYLSPIGKKAMALLPEISQSAVAQLQQAGRARMPDFEKRLGAQLKEAGIEFAP